MGKIKAIWSWPLTILVFMGAVAIGLFIYNNIPMEWHTSSGKIERTLHNWALKSKFSIKDNPQKYAQFQFILTDESNVRVVITNMKEDDQYRISIDARVNLSNQEQELFQELSQEEKLQFTSHIKLELLKFGIGFNLESFESSFDNVELSDVFVYDKSLTRTTFLKKLMFVRMAQLLFIEIIRTNIREIQQAQQAVSS